PVQESAAAAVVSLSLVSTDVARHDPHPIPTRRSSDLVTFDKQKPTATAVSLTSSNSNGAWAKVGDTITLTIVANEDTQTPVVQMDGKAAQLSSSDDSDAKTGTATYTMQESDAAGEVTF